MKMSKRSGGREPVDDGDVKRSKPDGFNNPGRHHGGIANIVQRLVTPDQASLLQRYLAQMAANTRERERGNCKVEAVPGALELIQNAVANLVGELWVNCVTLSKIRIDVAVHELIEPMIEEDLEPMVRIETIRNLDRDQRNRLARTTSPADSINNQIEAEEASKFSPDTTGGRRGRGMSSRGKKKRPGDTADLSGGDFSTPNEHVKSASYPKSHSDYQTLWSTATNCTNGAFW